MECEKFRDRFSALLEKELSPLEEKIVREHLASCPECLKDFSRFDKTIRWLRSIEEVEVPEGFLSGIYEKMEDRKRKRFWTDQVKRRWFSYPTSLKLPIQAVAMVATVFLVLYLTKMMPVEGPPLKDVEQTKAVHSEAKKMEKESIPKEMKRERMATQPPLEKPSLKDTEPARAPVSGEEETRGPFIPKVIEEEKRAAAPSPKTETVAAGTPRLKEAEKAKAAPSEPGKLEDAMATKEKASLAAKPSQEIILRISDRPKVVLQLQELVKRFGGETVKAEENVFFASLPATSFSEFEKEIVKLGSSAKAGKVMLQKNGQQGLGAPAGAKKREVEGKAQESVRSISEGESYITVRILLLQE